jgi:hypothetical protein
MVATYDSLHGTGGETKEASWGDASASAAGVGAAGGGGGGELSGADAKTLMLLQEQLETAKRASGRLESQVSVVNEVLTNVKTELRKELQNNTVLRKKVQRGGAYKGRERGEVGIRDSADRGEGGDSVCTVVCAIPTREREMWK